MFQNFWGAFPPINIFPRKRYNYYSCFISYCHKDKAFAKRLHADLQRTGIQCWIDSQNLKIGDTIQSTIDKNIKAHDKLLVILSEHSIASQWVEYEVSSALNLETQRNMPTLFPIRLDDAVMRSRIGWVKKIRQRRLIGDFTQWQNNDAYQIALNRLLRDLRVREVEPATCEILPQVTFQ